MVVVPAGCVSTVKLVSKLPVSFAVVILIVAVCPREIRISSFAPNPLLIILTTVPTLPEIGLIMTMEEQILKLVLASARELWLIMVIVVIP